MSAAEPLSAEARTRVVGRLFPSDADYASITQDISSPILRKGASRGWWAGLIVGGLGTLMMLISVYWLFYRGVGVWGVNTTVVWGFAIANYVWWIGIGNAGTLISCMLLLTRQKWRASINRFAEAMTLFAAAIAGTFPILHLGRPYFFYWLIPYPNIMHVWPQWRSPLVWDFFAISVYLIFSLIFWFTGAIPDFATLRDRAKRPATKRIFGALALGWRGSMYQWRHYDRFYFAMAALGVPLVVSVHSVVGMDFAASLMPGWQETIFPPYFVVGAMFSGFAMVVTLTIPIRTALGLEHLVTLRHLDAMGQILVAGSIIMGLSYATEWFMAWYSGGQAERFLTLFEFAGSYAAGYWILLFCNVLAPQALWWRRFRRRPMALLSIAILINIGMWLERVLIVINTLSRGYLPSQWRHYVPTVWDWTLTLGMLGFFAFLFFLFVRLVPVCSMHEIRHLMHGERKS